MIAISNTDREQVPDSAYEATRVCFFKRADLTFGIPADDVSEVIFASDLSRLPRSAPELVGLTQLRNRILPVMSPDRWLLIERKPFDPKLPLLVIEQKGHFFSFQVDSVEGVQLIPENQRIPHPHNRQHPLFGNLVAREGLVFATLLDLGKWIEDMSAISKD